MFIPFLDNTILPRIISKIYDSYLIYTVLVRYMYLYEMVQQETSEK